MPIRLRPAVLFAIAAAILFTLGSWLFVAKLSASLLGAIDAQLTAQLDRAGRYARHQLALRTAVRRQAARRGPAWRRPAWRGPTWKTGLAARCPVNTSSRSSTPLDGCAAAARTPGPPPCSAQPS
jgi:hypothetical protein